MPLQPALPSKQHIEKCRVPPAGSLTPWAASHAGIHLALLVKGYKDGLKVKARPAQALVSLLHEAGHLLLHLLDLVLTGSWSNQAGKWGTLRQEGRCAAGQCVAVLSGWCALLQAVACRAVTTPQRLSGVQYGQMKASS